MAKSLAQVLPQEHPTSALLSQLRESSGGSRARGDSASSPMKEFALEQEENKGEGEGDGDEAENEEVPVIESDVALADQPDVEPVCARLLVPVSSHLYQLFSFVPWVITIIHVSYGTQDLASSASAIGVATPDVSVESAQVASPWKTSSSASASSLAAIQEEEERAREQKERKPRVVPPAAAAAAAAVVVAETKEKEKVELTHLRCEDLTLVTGKEEARSSLCVSQIRCQACRDVYTISGPLGDTGKASCSLAIRCATHGMGELLSTQSDS